MCVLNVLSADSIISCSGGLKVIEQNNEVM